MISGLLSLWSPRSVTTANGSDKSKNPERFFRSFALRESCNRAVAMVLLIIVRWFAFYFDPGEIPRTRKVYDSQQLVSSRENVLHTKFQKAEITPCFLELLLILSSYRQCSVNTLHHSRYGTILTSSNDASVPLNGGASTRMERVCERTSKTSSGGILSKPKPKATRFFEKLLAVIYMAIPSCR